MSADDPMADVEADGRDETETERSDRNWNEILQELRVTQTGTQIITGFLLTLAFQTRFTELDGYQVSVYLVLVALAAVSTALGLAPVSLHRWLFRKHVKKQMVTIGSRILRITLAAVGLLVVGVVLFIFDVVVSRAAGFIAGGSAFILLVVLWIIVPVLVRSVRDRV
jgi:amino acid permease